MYFEVETEKLDPSEFAHVSWFTVLFERGEGGSWKIIFFMAFESRRIGVKSSLSETSFVFILHPQEFHIIALVTLYEEAGRLILSFEEQVLRNDV